MRIDHLAFRVRDHRETAEFFIKAMGYRYCDRVGTDGFRVDFEDGTWADCLVLVPPERKINGMSWTTMVPAIIPGEDGIDDNQEYHLPPEVFISQGSPDSIVDRWVEKNGNRLHHIALQVDDIESVKSEWKKAGYATFANDQVLTCPGLKQIFTDPSELTGFIWELIERDPNDDGFCITNVRNLMISTDQSL